MVEGGGLENRYTLSGIRGSNPLLSAIFILNKNESCKQGRKADLKRRLLEHQNGKPQFMSREIPPVFKIQRQLIHTHQILELLHGNIRLLSQKINQSVCRQDTLSGFFYDCQAAEILLHPKH